LFGKGVEKNVPLALEFLTKAANGGRMGAATRLGVLFATGIQNVPQNDTLAVEWWQKAANGGDVQAQQNLGLAYEEGMFGLASHKRCARVYYKAAAKQGAEFAIERLVQLKVCSGCGAPGAAGAMHSCAGCKSPTGATTTRYCTRECQKRHWKTHKVNCGGSCVCA
jgi:TPR repeat protein